MKIFKNVFCVLLAAVLLLGVTGLVACGDSSEESGTATESVTATESETPTETESDSETESITETESDSETESVTESETASEAPERWGELSEEEKDAKMAELDAAMPDRVQRFYGYGCPSDPNVYEASIEVFRQAGLTGIVSGDQFATSASRLDALCAACDEMDFDLIIDMWMPGIADEQERLAFTASCADRLVKRMEQYNCIRGVYLRDEPTMVVFPTLGAGRDAIVERLGEDPNFKIFVNLFPAHSIPAETGLKNQYADDGVSWLEGAQALIEIVRPTAFLFDRYPWTNPNRSSGNTPELYIVNLLEGRKAADPAGIPQWAYIPLVSKEGATTDLQLLLSAHLSLACNTEDFIMFTAYAASSYPGFVSGNGVRNQYFYRFKFVTDQINGMRCVYQDFDLQKVMTPGNSVYEEAIRYYDTEEYLVESYGVVESITTDVPLFVGCGVDDAGRNGYYVVNTGYVTSDPDASPVLVLTEECNYQIWGSEGLEDIGSGQEIPLELAPAEAYFVIVEPIR